MGRPKGSKNKKKLASTASSLKEYSLLVKMNGAVANFGGETLREAIKNITYIRPFTRVVLDICKGGVCHSFPLSIQAFNKLFNEGMTGEVQRALLEKRYYAVA